MLREINMEEISDGKLYGPNDMVKAECGDCMGCSSCCRQMGTSIVLDPYDIWQFSKGLGLSFGQLYEKQIELNVVDGIILPNLKMAGAEEKCSFLNEEGRCSIHPFRPGFCRLFPLGRIYEEDSFRYFLQIHECKKENRTKVKVKKWLGIPEYGHYEKFVCEWHYFILDLQQKLERMEDDARKNVNIYVLQQFFMKPYDSNRDFYEQFAERMNEASSVI